MLATRKKYSGAEARVIKCGLAIYFIGSLLMPETNLPDYAAYQTIYDLGGANFLLTGQDIGFVGVIQLSQAMGLSYTGFRTALKTLCLLIIWLATAQFERLSEKEAHTHSHPRLSSARMVALSVGLIIFLLEFYSVRIRAGLALAASIGAYSIFVGQPNSTRTLKRVFAVFLWFLAASIHLSTTVMLTYMILAPIIVLKLQERMLIPRQAIWATFGLTLCGFIFIGALLQASITRGENLISPLNPARLAAISILPLLLLAIGWRKISTYHKKSQPSRPGRLAHLGSRQERPWTFPNLQMVGYGGLAIAALLLAAAGQTANTGETFVRLYTLSSAIAVIGIHGTHQQQRFWITILAINGLFFLNTLNTPPPV